MARLFRLFFLPLMIASRAAAQSVSVLAGGGCQGFADGASSRWSCPTGVAAGASVLLVTDGANGVVRSVTPAGCVRTLAGAPGSSALVDGIGPAARFAGPLDLGIEPSGAAVVIADGNNHAIRRLVIVSVVFAVFGAAARRWTSGRRRPVQNWRRIRGVGRARHGVGVAAQPRCVCVFLRTLFFSSSFNPLALTASFLRRPRAR